MSINLNGSIRARLKKIIDVLDTSEGTPYVYTFIKGASDLGYKLMHNNECLLDDDNYIFYTEQDIDTFIKKQEQIIHKKIVPILIKEIDNSYLEGAMYD